MINNNDERPRYDAETGLPIKYDDDPITTVSSEPTNFVSEETVSMDSNEYNEAYSTSAAAEESNSSLYENYNRVEASNNEENFQLPDLKAQKVARKAAKKAAKKAKSNSGFRRFRRLAAAGIMFGVIAGSTMYGVYYTGVYYFPTSSNKSNNIQFATVNTSGSNGSTSGIVAQSDSATSLNVTSIAKAAMPAVVAISGTVTTSASNYFRSGTTEASTSGTGIIIAKSDTELLIVTNAHVVDGVNNLKVTFNDNEAVDASVKGTKSDKDIAVVAVKISDIKSSTINNIAIAELGDSESVQVGESVVAIGNALGEGQSVTVGWISALNRSITVDSTQYSNLIMTDAAINPGNSGGALLNAKGQVIGINSAKYASEEVEGMGYAIPISSVKDIIDNLMTKQTRTKVAASDAGYIGITGMDIPSNGYGFPGGVQISTVSSGSGAEKAGLVKGDIIVSFDGETVSSMTGLKSLLQYYAAGEKVAIEYYHVDNNNYVLKQVDVTLTRSAN